MTIIKWNGPTNTVSEEYTCDGCGNTIEDAPFPNPLANRYCDECYDNAIGDDEGGDDD
jgi:hypothetical protein